MEKSPVEILIFEDSPAQSMVTMLAESRKPVFSVQQVRTLADGLSLLRSRNFDAIIVDLDLPDSQGLETALAVRDQTRQTPIIVITGSDDEEAALEALQTDIHDYLNKVEVTGALLKHSIRSAIQRQRDLQAQRMSEQRFYSFMNNLAAPAWIKDLDGRYVFWSAGNAPPLSSFFPDRTGKTDEDGFPQETARQLRENDARVLATMTSQQMVEVMCVDGVEHHFIVNKFPILGAEGKATGVGGIALNITEGVRATEALRLSEARFRALHDESPVMIFTLDADGTIISTNSACTDQLGYRDYELTGQSVLKIFHEENRSAIVQQLERCRQNPDQVYRWQSRKIRKDGELLWVEETARVVYNLNGALNVLVVCQDITERKRAEEAILKSEKKFVTVFQKAPALLAITTLKHGIFIDVNETMLQTLGYRRDQMIGRSALELNLWEDLSDRNAILEALEETGSANNIEVRIRGKDGQTHTCLFSAEYIGFNGDQYILSLVEDITARKVMEEALRQREETLRLFVEHSPVPIVMVDKDMKYVYASRRWFKAFGLKDMDVRDRSHYDIFPDIPERWKEVHRRCLAGATERNEADHWERDDGTSVWTHWEITPWYKNSKEIGGLVILAEDITARKQAEQEIVRLNAEVAARAVELEKANLELEAFNYTVAHDLRSPLNLISGHCQIMMEACGVTLDEECRAYLQQTYDGALRMNKLISALLDFSRMAHAEPHRENLDLSAMALAVAAELRRSAPERNVDFRISEGVVLDGDRELLRVVLDNLLGNAYKYTSKRDDAAIDFGATEIDGEPACFVRDNGPGFDMSDAGNLFIPFRRLTGTSEQRGFGIGLATVDRIIRRHGGRIWAEGEPGKGATFYFTVGARG
ncbi:PAS domain S-box protein [Geobacter sp. SVR]|uniref:PAS domain S-box protein n=1 Tax=Geobacter sp. SVR TaxID=2495594 RepID=UPI00143EFFE4|nr:PAS domain S-box protein [Geobacter sp. SVR]BCS53416.1 hypothetical protein GSVR_17240 [Geobacter sp. SVR]GCF85458.1 hypothetical protein GSbR_20580 [Geobacter sp. SVR]